jgi:hypothetical protein
MRWTEDDFLNQRWEFIQQLVEEINRRERAMERERDKAMR